MKRRNQKGRITRLKHAYPFCLHHTVRCVSATTMAALLQLPAFFFSSCAVTHEDTLPSMERQIYIQWTNYPRQALLNCFYFDTKDPQNLDSFQQIPVWGEGTVPGLSSVGPRRLVILCDGKHRSDLFLHDVHTFTSGFFSPNFSLSISQISPRSLPCFSIFLMVL